MIAINLLPVRQIKKRNQARKQIFGMGITLLGVLAVLGLTAMVLGFKIDDLNANISQLQQEKAKYQTTINQIEQLKKDQKLLETKLNTISMLKKGSQLTVRVMDEIARLTPSNRLWINGMTFNGSVMTLTAIALDNATIADYMETILTSPYFVNVELSGTTNTGVSGRALKAFSLTINVVNAEFDETNADK